MQCDISTGEKHGLSIHLLDARAMNGESRQQLGSGGNAIAPFRRSETIRSKASRGKQNTKERPNTHPNASPCYTPISCPLSSALVLVLRLHRR